jgi:hypothetical protein
MSGKTERSQDFSKADEEARKCFKAFFEPAEGAFKADKKARKRLQGVYSSSRKTRKRVLKIHFNCFF